MKIEMKTITASKQRYPTVGDYWYAHGTRKIRVSDMKNKDYNFLVFLHEVIEQHLVEKRGISGKKITFFDITYEQSREALNPDCQDAPGNHKKCPYKKEHRFAENMERMMALELGVD